MTQANGSDPGDQRTPPLAQELDAVQVRYTWKFGEAGRPPAGPSQDAEPAGEKDELTALRAQVQHFTAALEDIVTLALSSADYKERAIMMHRRAVAALSGIPLPVRQPPER